MTTISIHPNPFEEKLSIQVEDWEDIQRVDLIFLDERSMPILRNGVNIDQLTKEFDLKALPPGPYRIKISLINGKSSTHQIVKIQ